MQPGELPGVDLLQLVVLGRRGGDSEETTPGGAEGSCPIRGLHPSQSIPRSQPLCWAPPLAFCPMVDSPWGLALSQAQVRLLQAQQ